MEFSDRLKPYDQIEPMPELPPRPSAKPVVIMWGVVTPITTLLAGVTHGYILALWGVYLAIIVDRFLVVRRRSKQFRAELTAWSERALVHHERAIEYLRQLEQRKWN